MSSIRSRIIKFSDNDNESEFKKNQKEIFHDSQMVYLWELNHSKDIDQVVVFEGYRTRRSRE